MEAAGQQLQILSPRSAGSFPLRCPSPDILLEAPVLLPSLQAESLALKSPFLLCFSTHPYSYSSPPHLWWGPR